jgi:hypothetical protein
MQTFGCAVNGSAAVRGDMLTKERRDAGDILVEDDVSGGAERQLFGRCGKLLRHSAKNSCTRLATKPRFRQPRLVRLHLRILLSSAASIRPRVYHPRTDGAPSRLSSVHEIRGTSSAAASTFLDSGFVLARPPFSSHQAIALGRT